jgi:hypothetical protein
VFGCCHVKSALTKTGQPASCGKNSRANVVFPAPLGPAMMMILGCVMAWFFFGIMAASAYSAPLWISPAPCCYLLYPCHSIDTGAACSFSSNGVMRSWSCSTRPCTNLSPTAACSWRRPHRSWGPHAVRSVVRSFCNWLAVTSRSAASKPVSKKWSLGVLVRRLTALCDCPAHGGR